MTSCDVGCQVVEPTDRGWLAGGAAGIWAVSGGGVAFKVLAIEGSVGESAWYLPAYAGVSDLSVARGGGEIWAAVTGADGGFWRSDDDGDSWSLVVADGWARSVDVDDRVPGRVLTASSSATLSGGFDESSGGLQVSLDGGRTFESVDGDLPWPFGLRVVTGPGVLWAVSPGVGLAVADDRLAR